MPNCGRKATPHVFYLWHREVSQSLEGQPAGFQKSSTCFLGSGLHRHCLCVGSQWAGMQLSPSTCCAAAAAAPSHFTARHCARFCAQLCANYSARQASVLCMEEHSCTVCTARAARQSGAGWLRGRACGLCCGRQERGKWKPGVAPAHQTTTSCPKWRGGGGRVQREECERRSECK